MTMLRNSSDLQISGTPDYLPCEAVDGPALLLTLPLNRSLQVMVTLDQVPTPART